MTTQSTPTAQAYFVRCAGQAESDSDGNGARPAQPATDDKPQGQPEKPTKKPLPDLPNPGEVGEDG